MLDKKQLLEQQFEAIHPEEQFSLPDFLLPIYHDEPSTLSLLSMNTGIHGFFYHRDEVPALDAPFPDLCEVGADEFESQPSNTKKPKSLDSTDNLEDNSSTATTLSPFSLNNDPAH